jgi:copper resistance protein B
MKIFRLIFGRKFSNLLAGMSLLISVSSVNAQEIKFIETGSNFQSETPINNQEIAAISKNVNDLIFPSETIQPSQILEFAQHHQHPSENIDEEAWPSPIHDNQIYGLLLVDQLEYRVNSHTNSFNWDMQGWMGGDKQRLWLKTEGNVSFDDASGEAEVQVLYSRLIAPFWDFQTGLRYDRIYSSDTNKGRAFAVFGVEGLTPYLFEVDTALFISEQGDISLRFTAEQDLLITQRLILQPKLETNFAIQQVEDFGVGSGINDLELGLRLRYEINRKFAPYIGINWTKKFGDTANFAKKEGESVDDFVVVGGLRLLF